MVPDCFKGVMPRDFAGLFLGDRIGEGMSRKVYRHKLHAGLVIKMEEAGGRFQNVYEHQVWEHVQHTALAKWFAPVVAISPCGGWLLMERTRPLPEHMLPAKVPAFFTDMKRQNWGLLKGRAVCHDYGTHLMLEKGMSARLRKADFIAEYDD